MGTVKRLRPIIWHFANGKGGVGKTTMACNFAARRALAGRRVALINCDKQRHAMKWADRRARITPALPKIEAFEVLERAKTGDVLRREFAGFDDLVVDTAGNDTASELRAVLTVADVAIIPLAVAEIDLEACESMRELLEQARAFNPKLQAIAFLNKVPTSYVRAKDITEAASYVSTFDESMRLAQTLVRYRDVAFSEPWGQGRAAAEFGARGQAAAEDFHALALEIEALGPGGSNHGGVSVAV